MTIRRAFPRSRQREAQAAARKYWDASRLQIVAVGDVTKVRPILEKIGPVAVYDADGKPIP